MSSALTYREAKNLGIRINSNNKPMVGNLKEATALVEHTPDIKIRAHDFWRNYALKELILGMHRWKLQESDFLKLLKLEATFSDKVLVGTNVTVQELYDLQDLVLVYHVFLSQEYPKFIKDIMGI